MKRRAAIGLFLAAVSIGSVLVACESIIGANFGSVKEIDCAHVSPPDAPPSQGVSTGHDLVFVVSTFDLGDEDDSNGGHYRTIGYDLDHVCTNEGQPGDCQSPPWANGDPTDGIDGRDNAIGQLVHSQSVAFGSTVFQSPAESMLTSAGKNAPIALFHVIGYSGEADDDQVIVEWYTPSIPLSGLPVVDWKTTPVVVPVSLASVTPNASGNADAGNADGGAPAYAAKFVDMHAYVNHSTLVAHFSSGPAVQFTNVPFPVVNAVLTGTLSGTNMTLANGTLAGIVQESDMFRLLPRFTQQLIGQPVCQTEAYYKQIKSFYCQFVDILLSGNPDPNKPCDGDSFGVSFQTVPAVLGPAVDDSVPELCPGGVVIDDCTNPP